MRILPRRHVALLVSLATIVGCSAVLGINEIPLAGDFPVNANGRSCPQLESDLVNDPSTVCPACVAQARTITGFTCVPAMTASEQVSAVCTCPAPDSGGGPGGSGGSNGTGGIIPDSGTGGGGGFGGIGGSGGNGGVGFGGVAGNGGSKGGKGGKGSGGGGDGGGNTCDAGSALGAGGPSGSGAGDSGLSCITNPVTCDISCSLVQSGPPGK